MPECFQERSKSEEQQIPFGEMHPKGSIAERIALGIANSLFLPVDRQHDQVFLFPARVAVITFFLTLIVVSLPPIVVYVTTSFCDLFPLSSMRISPGIWLTWSKFASLSIEILFVLAITGTVFGEWTAARSRSTLEELEKRFEQAQTLALTDTRDKLANELRAYMYLFSDITVSNLMVRLWQAYELSQKIARTLTNKVPQRTATFLAAKFTVAFPGGLYGLVAFVLFGLLSLTKVVQIYADQIAATSLYMCP